MAKLRRSNTITPMSSLLGRLNITGFDAVSYIMSNAHSPTALPNIAIAATEGGYRAMLDGARVIKALDSREENSIITNIGGLLRSVIHILVLSEDLYKTYNAKC